MAKKITPLHVIISLQEQLLNDSEKFMTEYFATMHYDKINRLDNCTRLFRKTDQWTDYHQLSGRACPSTEYNTPFCQCVRMVRYKVIPLRISVFITVDLLK